MLSFSVTWIAYPHLVILGGSLSNWACSPPLSLALLTTKLLLSSLSISGITFLPVLWLPLLLQFHRAPSVSIKDKGRRNDFPQRILSIYSISTVSVTGSEQPGSHGAPVRLFLSLHWPKLWAAFSKCPGYLVHWLHLWLHLAFLTVIYFSLLFSLYSYFLT